MKTILLVFLLTIWGTACIYGFCALINHVVCPEYTCSDERIRKAYQDAYDYRY